jgi:hypothetical protein
VLQDNDTLSSSKITDLDVIHMVARTSIEQQQTESEEQIMNNDSNNSTASQIRRGGLIGILNPNTDRIFQPGAGRRSRLLSRSARDENNSNSNFLNI